MQMAATSPLPRRWVPLAVAAVAVPTFVAFWIGGRPALGAAWALVSVAFGVMLAFGGRSDTIRLMRGEADDERTLMLEYQALTATALVTTVALAGLFLVDAVRGGTGLIYGLLLILIEATHLAALAVLNRRS